jgi:hypothetical protein
MKQDKKYMEARAWFYTFKSQSGYQVESRLGKVLHRSDTWQEATQWAVENISKIDDHEESKS